jgi:hypothetical protein
MTHRAATLTIAVSLFLLSSCVVFKDVPYFGPRTSAEVAVANTFRGLPEIASYRLASTQFRIVIFERGPQLKLLFTLSEGETARFLSGRVQAVAMSDGESVTQDMEEVQANHITDGRGRFHYTAPTEPMVGSTYTNKTTPVPRSFEVTVSFSKPLPTNFRLKLPNIVLSGVEHTPPLVEFSRTVGSAYMGSPP